MEIVNWNTTRLLRSLVVLEDIKTESHDEETGVAIVRRALQEPLRCIAENSGEEGAVIVKKVLGGKGNFGFNALTLDFDRGQAVVAGERGWSQCPARA